MHQSFPAIFEAINTLLTCFGVGFKTFSQVNFLFLPCQEKCPLLSSPLH